MRYIALNILEVEEIFWRPSPNGLGFLVENRKLRNCCSSHHALKIPNLLEPLTSTIPRALKLSTYAAPYMWKRTYKAICWIDATQKVVQYYFLLQSVPTAICDLEQNESQSIKATYAVFPTRFTHSRMDQAGWCRKQSSDLAGYSVIGAHHLAALPR